MSHEDEGNPIYKRTIKLELLDPKEFRLYGMVLDYSGIDSTSEKESRFDTLFTTNAGGWAIASSHVKNRTIKKIAYHPETAEAFIPISGCAVIVVAELDSPENLRAFILERPVLIREKTWHATLTLTRSSEIRIVENSSVSGVPKLLEYHLEPGLLSISKE